MRVRYLLAAGAAALVTAGSRPATALQVDPAWELTRPRGPSLLTPAQRQEALRHDWVFYGIAGAIPAREAVFGASEGIRRNADVAGGIFLVALERVDSSEIAQDFVWYKSARYEFQCGARRYRTYNGLLFQAMGGVVRDPRRLEIWLAVPTGSSTEIMMRTACAGGQVPGSYAVSDPIEEGRRLIGAGTGEAMRRQGQRPAPAAAESRPPTGPSATRQGQPASGWWYLGQSGQAPERALVFADRSIMRRTGDMASSRVRFVFERPRAEMHGFVITYEFRCGAGQFQSRDPVFSTTSATEEPANGVAAAWSAVTPDSAAALVLDAACFGRFGGEARAIALAPADEAARIFAGAPPTAAAALPPPATRPSPSAGRPRLVPRAELACRLRNGETAQQVSRQPDPIPPACRPGATGAAGASRALPRAVPGRVPQAAYVICPGVVFTNGRGDNRVSVELRTIEGGSDRTRLILRPDAFGLSGTYPVAVTASGISLSLRNNITARLDAATGRFTMRWVYSWDEEDLDPNNPFGTYRATANMEITAECPG